MAGDWSVTLEPRPGIENDLACNGRPVEEPTRAGRDDVLEVFGGADAALPLLEVDPRRRPRSARAAARRFGADTPEPTALTPTVSR